MNPKEAALALELLGQPTLRAGDIGAHSRCSPGHRLELRRL